MYVPRFDFYLPLNEFLYTTPLKILGIFLLSERLHFLSFTHQADAPFPASGIVGFKHALPLHDPALPNWPPNSASSEFSPNTPNTPRSTKSPAFPLSRTSTILPHTTSLLHTLCSMVHSSTNTGQIQFITWCLSLHLCERRSRLYAVEVY